MHPVTLKANAVTGRSCVRPVPQRLSVLGGLAAWLAILALPGAGLAHAEPSVVAANPALAGTWRGDGRFLNVAMDKAMGKVPLTVEIKPDGTIAGSIGDAKLTQTSITKARYGFEIHGILDARIRKDKAETKDHLIVLLVTPAKDKDGALVSDANFHLKRYYLFDLTMRVGGVMLKKQP